MTATTLRIEKVNTSLPGTLTANTLYFVKTGSSSFDIYLTNAAGTVAYTSAGSITGGASTIATSDLTASRALASNSSGKVVVSSVTDTELSYVSGVTSAIQTQLGNKQASSTDLTAIAALVGTSGILTKTGAGTWALDTSTYITSSYFTGGVSTILTSNLTTNRALLSDGSGKVAVSTVTNTELSYVSGVTSAIQTQLGTKLASASYTAADVLSKLLTVSGAGSSLDADLLDGQHGSYYLDLGNATGTLSNAKTSATSSNTGSTIVLRDSSGNFSAGTITAALTGTASSSNGVNLAAAEW